MIRLHRHCTSFVETLKGKLVYGEYSNYFQMILQEHLPVLHLLGLPTESLILDDHIYWTLSNDSVIYFC